MNLAFPCIVYRKAFGYRKPIRMMSCSTGLSLTLDARLRCFWALKDQLRTETVKNLRAAHLLEDDAKDSGKECEVVQGLSKFSMSVKLRGVAKSTSHSLTNDE